VLKSKIGNLPSSLNYHSLSVNLSKISGSPNSQKKPDNWNECDFVYFVFCYSPGELESTGEPTGDAVGNRNRNVVTND